MGRLGKAVRKGRTGGRHDEIEPIRLKFYWKEKGKITASSAPEVEFYAMATLRDYSRVIGEYHGIGMLVYAAPDQRPRAVPPSQTRPSAPLPEP